MSKIYELAEQAAEHAVVNPSELNLESELDDVKVVIPKEFIDKFSELIVQECAQVYWNIDNGEIHAEYVEALKEHFGVK